jgi:uncharacterized protein YndB with AHSA1/START domain
VPERGGRSPYRRQAGFDIEEAGSTFRVSGNYLTLQRPRRVAFTWSCSTWPDPALQTVVTVTIEPDGAEASIMTIEHDLLPPALVQQHAHGWTVISTQLESRLHPAKQGSRRTCHGIAVHINKAALRSQRTATND